jgi:hypothetical protein
VHVITLAVELGMFGPEIRAYGPHDLFGAFEGARAADTACR